MILDRTETLYPADSLEFDPYQCERFAVGTYKLDEGTGPTPADRDTDTSGDEGRVATGQKRKRLGQIHFYAADDRDPGDGDVREDQRRGIRTSIRPLEVVDHPAAILDMKWTRQTINESSTLVVADALGCVTAYTWGNVPFLGESGSVHPIAQSAPSAANSSSDFLALSVDVSPQPEGSDGPSILVSYNTGGLEVLRLPTSSATMRPIARLDAAHSLEAWTCCWDGYSGAGDGVFWSGGDDGCIMRWDLRVSTERSVAVDKSSHAAGVTSLLVPPIPSRPHYLLSGSYDEHLLLWDTRFWKPGRPLLDHLNEGGGVWRIKHLQRNGSSGDMVLGIAGMHRGFDVIHIDGITATCAASLPLPVPTALAYGIDFSRDVARLKSSGSALLGCCSFYDRTVQLWEVDLNDGAGASRNVAG